MGGEHGYEGFFTYNLIAKETNSNHVLRTGRLGPHDAGERIWAYDRE